MGIEYGHRADIERRGRSDGCGDGRGRDRGRRRPCGEPWCATAGGEAFVSRGESRTIIGLSGDIDRFAATLNLAGLPGVADVVRISVPYKLVSREHRRERSVIRVAGVPIGPDTLTVIAGPCAVETPEQTLAAARMARGGRRVAAARRRVQAADLALRVPGPRRGGAEDPRRGARGDRAADRHRGHRPARRGPGRDVRRHAAGRHPQHAELPAAAGGRRGGQAGHAQARHVAPPSRSG